MEDTIRQVLSILQGMWLKRWFGLAVAAAVAAVGLVGVGLIKDRYEATASVYVDTQSVLKPLMTGLAFQPDIDQQVAMLARTLISRPNIERLLDNRSLGLKPSDPREYDALVAKLVDSIKINPGKGNFYSITYRSSSREQAGKVVEGLVNMFVTSGVGDKRRDSEDARRFIDEQIRTYEAKLSEAESRLRDFKVKNLGVTGGNATQDYFGRIAALQDDIGRLRLELRAAEQASVSLKKQLSEENPQMPIEALGGQFPVQQSEIDARLEAARRQLDDLLRRYTDEHPDVVAARRTITRIEQQKKQEMDAARSSLAGGGRMAPAATSPIFQRLKIALAESEARAASLRAQLGEQEARLAQARAMAGKMPEIEAELAQLNRDYDVIRKNYEQLVARRESAAMGVKIDETAHAADFRIIEPPRVLPKPVFPSRVILAALVLLASFGAGVVATFGLTQLLPTFHNAKALGEFSGRPVLGAVSMVVNDVQKRVAARNVWRFAGACATLMAVQCGWILWVWQQSRI